MIGLSTPRHLQCLNAVLRPAARAGPRAGALLQHHRKTIRRISLCIRTSGESVAVLHIPTGRLVKAISRFQYPSRPVFRLLVVWAPLLAVALLVMCERQP